MDGGFHSSRKCDRFQHFYEAGVNGLTAWFARIVVIGLGGGWYLFSFWRNDNGRGGDTFAGNRRPIHFSESNV